MLHEKHYVYKIYSLAFGRLYQFPVSSILFEAAGREQYTPLEIGIIFKKL